MAKNKKTVKQQMRKWRVGIGYGSIVVRARTARSSVRIYLRGNLVHDVMVRELELDNPSNPRPNMPSEVLREKGMKRRLKGWTKGITEKDIHVEPA